MEIKRGYVKWEDADGLHKELLSDYPEMLAKASAEQKISAEEARRLNEDGEKQTAKNEGQDFAKLTLEALVKAPADVLTTGDLIAVDDGKGGEKIVPADDVVAVEKPTLVLNNKLVV